MKEVAIRSADNPARIKADRRIPAARSPAVSATSREPMTPPARVECPDTDAVRLASSKFIRICNAQPSFARRMARLHLHRSWLTMG
jgi:hypothetical protein